MGGNPQASQGLFFFLFPDRLNDCKGVGELLFFFHSFSLREKKKRSNLLKVQSKPTG